MPFIDRPDHSAPADIAPPVACQEAVPDVLTEQLVRDALRGLHHLPDAAAIPEAAVPDTLAATTEDPEAGTTHALEPIFADEVYPVPAGDVRVAVSTPAPETRQAAPVRTVRSLGTVGLDPTSEPPAPGERYHTPLPVTPYTRDTPRTADSGTGQGARPPGGGRTGGSDGGSDTGDPHQPDNGAADDPEQTPAAVPPPAEQTAVPGDTVPVIQTAARDDDAPKPEAVHALRQEHRARVGVEEGTSPVDGPDSPEHPIPRDEGERPHYTEVDHEFVRQMLGVEGHYCDLNAPEYDERQVIGWRLIEQREQRRARLVGVAQEAGGYSADEAIARGEAWEPNEQELKHLFASPEVRKERKRAAMLDGVDTFVEDYEAIAVTMGVPLRKNQIPAVHDFQGFMLHTARSEGGGKRGIFEMATGLGKTAILSKVVAALKHSEDPDDPIRILILVPTNTILEQTIGRHGERGLGKFAPHLRVGVQNEYQNYAGEEICVMTTASFDIMMRNGTMPEFDAVAIDEVHTVLGEVTFPRVQAYCRDRLAIGLSATPAYDPERSAYTFFEHQIHLDPVREAIRDGKLAPVKAEDLEIEPVYLRSEIPQDPAERRAFMRRAQLRGAAIASVRIIRESVERGVGVIVRCPAGEDIKFARDFAAELNGMAVHVHGGGPYETRWLAAHFVGGSAKRQSREEREAAQRLHGQGQIDVLTYVKAIGMGYDSLHTKVWIDLAGSDSQLEVQQGLGRALRLSFDSDGNPIPAEVYSFRDPMRRNQATVCSVLGVKSGETIIHDPHPAREIPLPAPRQRRRRTALPTVAEVRVSVANQVVIENALTPESPSSAEIGRTVEQIRGSAQVSFSDACRILGISPVTLKQILSQFGYVEATPDTVKLRLDDIGAIIDTDEFRGLQVLALPETGYTLDADAAVRLGVQRRLTLRAFAARHGIHHARMRTPDGRVGFYYSDQQLADLRQLIQEEGFAGTFQ
jgi:superfamily II DNA or RNA helicase